MKKTARAFAIVMVAFVLAGLGFGYYLIQRGFSARAEPSALDAFPARRVRRLAMPAGARDAQNPVALTPQVLRESMEHFADHCATCHSNDGSGATSIAKGLYPKPPDMRQAQTQDLTDGELFYIIHNGIRFTGMPAFGEEMETSKDEDSWKLVYFIRRLPKITVEELEEMEKFNPKSPAELAEEQELERFLRGEDVQPKPHGH